MDADVIVIGAGLAGLQCARRLQRNGFHPLVLEAEAEVGGRVRTEAIDGFLCDRGFQVLNPAYPAVRAWVDMPALGLQAFGTGVQLRTDQGTATLAHPLRHPRQLPATLSSGLLDLGDLLGLARWLGPTLVRARTSSRATSDQSLEASLDAAGITGRLRQYVVDTFLAGVLADSTGQSSANYVRLLLRSFVLATPGLPRTGMQALPEQLAACLLNPVRLSTPARAVRQVDGGIEVDTDGGVLRAAAGVVAVGPHQVAGLLDEPAPITHGLTTWWFQAPSAPTSSPFLLLDGRGSGGGPSGPIWSTAVVSNAAPSYAPAGTALVQATTLLDRTDGMADERAVRADLAELYGVSVDDWQVLAHHVIPHTLPAMPPPLVDRAPQRVADRLFVCGDHRDTGSIQGALVSGDRAGNGVSGLLT